MRTTVTLDPDTDLMIRQRMKDRRVSFKQALNDAIREGCVSRGEPEPFRTETAAMGPPAVNLDRALQVAAELDDEDFARRMQTGS